MAERLPEAFCVMGSHSRCLEGKDLYNQVKCVHQEFCLVGYNADISEEHVASIFRVG
jgi:hypothetical protein